jgi:predicted alpha/beta hydrolase family esterase
MQKKVFIIPGLHGWPNSSWFPWLMSELKKNEIWACSLAMPKADEPILFEWLEEIDTQINRNPNSEIYLVGQSLGSTAILRYFETRENAIIKGVVLVAASCTKATEQKVGGFRNTDFDFSIISSRIPKSVIIHGDNDTFASVETAELLAKELDSKLIIIPNGGHLNGSAGFRELPQALNALLEIMKE